MTAGRIRHFMAILIFSGAACHSVVAGVSQAHARDQPRAVQRFFEANCWECHNSELSEAGLDLESLRLELDRRENFDRWVLIHDRMRDGEMPPPEDGIPRRIVPIGWSSRANENAHEVLSATESTLRQLASSLIRADQHRISKTGRAKVRRLNRVEYENTLRVTLSAPWLHIADLLPVDGIDHLFQKSGERLDVSHVQLKSYLTAAEHALRQAVSAAAHPSESRKFYAREEPVLQHYLRFRDGQKSSTRSIVPLLGTTPDPDVIRGQKDLTVGDSDPETREQEAMGVFCGTYGATTKYDFTRINAPTDGYYQLRFKTYTYMAGPNGATGGEDHGLTGGKRDWWRPDRNVAFPGKRSEPITLYALGKSGDSRWLTTFDSFPEPSVFSGVVPLRQGDGIRPDAARLVRTRPGWDGNPNAAADGVPGFAMNWLEVTGPLHESWPPESYQAIFEDLPFEVDETGQVKVISEQPQRDAQRLLGALYRRLVDDPTVSNESIQPYIRLFQAATDLGQDFTDAMIAAGATMLCSPEFIYLDAQPGPLPERALQRRLSYFLWNSPPDPRVFDGVKLSDSPATWRLLGERVLRDPRFKRFVSAFLDYWLDLREINLNAPDAELYPDYYLDELLTESSVRETRMFFQELIGQDLPARNLVDANFTFVNERLATHYDLPSVQGVEPRCIELPENSPYGGLMTQASVLRVTANGTTTSPVVRGAWIMERIMGVRIPPPPSGVAAVEPDIRGAKTIREQMVKHRAVESCNTCHARFDPVGFALENFDVAGGWRDRYRAIGEPVGQSVKGIGKNGHTFKFRLAQPVDSQSTLLTGESFNDVQSLKKLLASQERQLARNLLQRLMVYATGAPVSFADRREVEEMLDRAKEKNYGVRTLIHEVIQSQMFCIK